jgi:glycosyltransferase involved in cell wall biosynthesis
VASGRTAAFRPTASRPEGLGDRQARPDPSDESSPRGFKCATRRDGLPEIAILLCTKDGGRYLAPQLGSFAAQSRADWRLWVSDDGSCDDTVKILEGFEDTRFDPRDCLLKGPGTGAARNFLSVACNPAIQASYFAFADQDDVWEPDKFARAIAWLERVPERIPALYCSRSRVIDSHGRTLCLSPLFAKPPSFANALVQNLAGGHTMVMNAAARELIVAAGQAADPLAHDWWTYQLVSGAGGRVFYDPHPTVSYRQHDSNLVGAGVGPRARLKRLRLLMNGQFRRWNDVNIRELWQVLHLLTPGNRDRLKAFAAARECRLKARLTGFRRAGIYRQTLAGTVSLVVGAATGRI